MKQRIYLDTSVPSAYYDEKKQERQGITQVWWEGLNERYEVYISEIVEAEINATPDLELRAKIYNLVRNFKVLEVTAEVRNLAGEYIKNELFSEENFRDALHVAIATVNNIDVLVSWNFNHIVNYDTKKKVKAVNLLRSYRDIDIESPVEMGGGKYV